jgi:hypothetical protein
MTSALSNYLVRTLCDESTLPEAVYIQFGEYYDASDAPHNVREWVLEYLEGCMEAIRVCRPHVSDSERKGLDELMNEFTTEHNNWTYASVGVRVWLDGPQKGFISTLTYGGPIYQTMVEQKVDTLIVDYDGNKVLHAFCSPESLPGYLT